MPGKESVINLGGPAHISPLQSLFPSLVDSPWSLDRARSPAAKHFDAIQLNSFIKSTLMFNVLKKSMCMQSSAAGSGPPQDRRQWN